MFSISGSCIECVGAFPITGSIRTTRITPNGSPANKKMSIWKSPLYPLLMFGDHLCPEHAFFPSKALKTLFNCMTA